VGFAHVHHPVAAVATEDTVHIPTNDDDDNFNPPPCMCVYAATKWCAVEQEAASPLREKEQRCTLTYRRAAEPIPTSTHTQTRARISSLFLCFIFFIISPFFICSQGFAAQHVRSFVSIARFDAFQLCMKQQQ